VINVGNQAAFDTARALARYQGIAGRISAGLPSAAALQVGKRRRITGKTIVVSSFRSSRSISVNGIVRKSPMKRRDRAISHPQHCVLGLSRIAKNVSARDQIAKMLADAIGVELEVEKIAADHVAARDYTSGLRRNF
jgi:hypothetical protein